MGERSGERADQSNNRTPYVSRHSYIHHDSTHKTETCLEKQHGDTPISNFIAGTLPLPCISMPQCRGKSQSWSPCKHHHSVHVDTCAANKLTS
ncbi:hypothetical protein TNCV_3686511 [Trichonephila clavipes]|nr:hypothetical protein TNCV_3686511 [Trichonephila clavipes]